MERRDALLEELRQLHAAYREDAAVRERLAKGLFDTLVDAEQEETFERRDALLEELRRLHAAYQEDAAVRKHLATALFNTLVDAEQGQAFERRDALLEELRQLHAAYREDAALSYANGRHSHTNQWMGFVATLEEAVHEKSCLVQNHRALRLDSLANEV